MAVLIGGPSAEHDISLSTGKVVMEHLDREKYDIVPVLISRSGEWAVDPEELKEVADIAFIALHGEYGEDGEVQKVLEDVGMPYTGSGVIPSALGMNKIFSARLLKAYGLDVPEYVPVRKGYHPGQLKLPFDFPVVVKPVDRGSSVGTMIVRKHSELHEALENAFQFSDNAMIQEYIPGREFTCGVIDDEDETIAFPVTEIIPKAATFFDYHSKYTQNASREITPAEISEKETKKIQDIAVRVHKYIGAYGMSRTDFILGHNGKLYVLEINTIPGMTPTSLLPQEAIKYGLSFPQLLDKIIKSGFRRYGVTDGGD